MSVILECARCELLDESQEVMDAKIIEITLQRLDREQQALTGRLDKINDRLGGA